MKIGIGKLILMLLLLQGFESYAQKIRLSGTIYDEISGELLPLANLKVENLDLGTQSNSYGYYSIRLNSGTYNISVSYLGYKSHIVKLLIDRDTSYDIHLLPQGQILSEVEIKGNQPDILNDIVPGKTSMSISQVKSMPTMTGEADIFQSLQYLPGIKAAVEGNTGISVRGGSFDQTLVLLDDAPVYNASHALGFFSAFNPDAIRSVEIYKGIIPAQFGGRLSSVVDLKMREGNNNQFKVTGGIGAIASKVTVEGPMHRKRSSFIISGRYSYAGSTANLLGKVAQNLNSYPFRNFIGGNDIRFYDLNAKVNWESKNGKDHFYLSGYAGSDWFKYYIFQQGTFMKWQNNTVSFRWNHIHRSNLFSNTTAYFSRYNYNYSLLNDKRDFEWKAGLTEIGLKREWDYFMDDNSSFKGGVAMSYTRYQPGSITPRTDSSITTPFSLRTKATVQLAPYAGYNRKLSSRVTLYAGLRFSTYALAGPGTSYVYSEDRSIVTDSTAHKRGSIMDFRIGIEPRLSAIYLIDSNSSFSFAYSRSRQYAHLLSASAVGLPTDIWLPANHNVKPQSASLLSVGYKRQFGYYTFSLEGYAKTMNGVIDFVDHADLFINQHVESQVRSGKGKAFGLETIIERKAGKLTGWITYTLAKTDRTIGGINGGLPYPTRYDRRHSFSLVTSYRLRKNFSISVDFQYNSGAAVSIPTGVYEYMGTVFNYYSSRNGYRLPAFHRLDVQATFMRKKRKWERQFTIGIFNVYDKRNIFSVELVPDIYSQPHALSLVSAISLYGVMPFLSYGFKF